MLIRYVDTVQVKIFSEAPTFHFAGWWWPHSCLWTEYQRHFLRKCAQTSRRNKCQQPNKHRKKVLSQCDCRCSSACRHYCGRKYQLQMHVAMHDWPCIHPVTTIPYINLCLNLAANAKNRKRKTEEDDEESTQTRMTSKQVCAVCSCWHQTKLSG